MADLFDKDGNAVSALTPEEVQAQIDAKVAEAIETTKGEVGTQLEKAKTDIQALEDAKTELEDKLKGFDDKGTNFKAARTAIEKKDAEIEDLKKSVGELTTKLTKDIEEIKQGAQKQTISQQILESVGGDKELAAKVEIAYKKFAPGITPEAILENIQNALIIASGGKQNKIINSKIVDGSGGADIRPKNLGKLSEGADQVAKNLGLTDADLKKAGLT